MSSITTTSLRSLGVYGYDHVEPVIIAALVTGDPLLLIGKAGTGKSFLLNSLSEALELEHRHYNASLIAFDDLVGFPYPEENGTGIRYIETPATVWQAESVLIDEISRCKPEHQNRLFSLVHERRVQGMKLDKLRYRWAAMNPCSVDQGVEDYYDGSVPLDQALADRFAFVIQVPDWDELEDKDRELIADPTGDGIISRVDGTLQASVSEACQHLGPVTERYRRNAVGYAVTAANVLKRKRIRLSPRRVRMLAKNLLALTAVHGTKPTSDIFRLALGVSLPQPAWGVEIDDATLQAAHELAWTQAFLNGREKWLNTVFLENRLYRKIDRLLTGCPDPDTGAVAIARTLADLDPVERATLAFALYPAVLQGAADFGSEGLAALARAAEPILEVDSEISWQERTRQSETKHPQLDACSRVLAKLSGKRRLRARQLFYHLVAEDIPFSTPKSIQPNLELCIRKIATILRKQAEPAK